MAQKFLSIKNFEKYQTSTPGKARSWIKLHKAILGDPEFMKLSTHHKFLYTGLLLLADDCGNRIYNDRTYLGQRLYISPTEIDLKPLYRAGFLYTSNLSRELLEESRAREELELEGEAAQAPPPSPSVVPLREKKKLGPLPDDFKFNADLRNWALEKGCKEPFAEFERFCTKAKAKGWTYTDWTQAYQNWVLNELKWAREKADAAM